MVHRVARDDLVAYREWEGEAEDDSGLACAVVALLRELLEEVVAAGYPDLAERDLFEEGQDEGAHVALVQEPGRGREPV